MEKTRFIRLEQIESGGVLTQSLFPMSKALNINGGRVCRCTYYTHSRIQIYKVGPMLLFSLRHSLPNHLSIRLHCLFLSPIHIFHPLSPPITVYRILHGSRLGLYRFLHFLRIEMMKLFKNHLFRLHKVIVIVLIHHQFV